MLVGLWLEITIAGFVYLIAFLFLVAAYFRIGDARIFVSVKDFVPYLSASSIAISYVFGIISHRVIQILSSLFAPIRLLVFRRDERNQKQTKEHELEMARIRQYGSVRTQREIEIQFGWLVLLRSLILSVPLLGFTVVVWLVRTKMVGSEFVIVIDLAFWVLCCFVYNRQRDNYYRVRVSSVAVVEESLRASIPK